eukprot:gnl/MRDRNA2_/MRDRNA2_113232_c0_seq1.p1 gnl/MRDRNA2_/MRDRNA2_113232_c0~~gnl/MRDRNA2_/MRDRNA2_113232_c0_seq1.p1  ORF type:complete len:259 (+),score=47.63 gnl/MRDRNA2_/MRDRNA2_113232_c0_seq1:59-835(+)
MNPSTLNAGMSIRILSLNIWFSKHGFEERMAAIAEMLKRHDPFVVAVQEMTDEHFAELQRHDAWNMFQWSMSPGDGGYYTLIGSKLQLKSPCKRSPFPQSRMGRDLLSCSLLPSTLPGASAPFGFATSHLESLDFAKERKSQMMQLFGELNQYEDAIFCGDTNINEAIDGETVLPAGWQDAWQLLRPGEPGFTFDVKTNTYIQQYDGWAVKNNARLRFDRFWVRLRNYQVKKIEVLTEPLCSDHYGVLLDLGETRTEI